MRSTSINRLAAGTCRSFRDIVVGDAEGVVVIPRELGHELAAEAAAMDEFETWVEDQIRNGRSLFGLYPPSAETQIEFQERAR